MTATEEPPRRRGRPPSGGREAIVEAALEILRGEGIANLTSREVAARAGVSDASVYYHFGDRAGLLQAVFEQGMKPLKFMAGLDLKELEPAAVIEASVAALERFFGDVLPIMLAAQADPALRASIAAFVEAKELGPHKGVKLLGGYLRAQQKAGRVSADADPDALALIIIDSAFAHAARKQMLLHTAEHLPSSESVLAEISRLLS
ncbi:MAG TPA: TetR/AcrR family transcriptional regulator [Solirubrobacteraceae bacterium]|jgi:AcrR family transcriptional regulator|nr:TetR/AcrR family transcriptional regulator [Solirubrobacteraceae bacterium]